MQRAESNGNGIVILLMGAIVLIGIVARNQFDTPTTQSMQMTAGQIPPEQAGVREIHGAVEPSNCRKMEERFKREGRRVRLTGIKPNPYGSGGFSLRFVCIFEGPDATPGYYTGDRRYEGADEWQVP